MPSEIHHTRSGRTSQAKRLQLVAALLMLLLSCLLPPHLARMHAAPDTRHEVGQPAHGFGVQMMRDISERQGLSLAVAAGAQWVRIAMFWSQIEPLEMTPPQYDWTFYDQSFHGAADAGLNLIVTVTDNPVWAGIGEPYTRCGPIRSDKLDRFTAFMAAAVARYSGPPYHVQNWELYNEPDNSDPWTYPAMGGCWSSPVDNQALDYPEQYARMLIAVSEAIRVVDPEAKLWLGGVAYDYWYDGSGGPFQPLWLERVLTELKRRAGARFPVFDVFNFHHYPFFRWRWEGVLGDPLRQRDVIGKTLWLRHMELGPFGLSNMPMAITEISRPSAGPASTEFIMSDERTARYVPKAFARALAAGIGYVIWYHMVDNAEPNKYGLLAADGSPRAAYDAYKTTLTELGGAAYQENVTESVELEGYRFRRGGEDIWVVWREDYPERITQYPSVPWTVSADRVQVVTHLGSMSEVADGEAGDQDGVANGRIQLKVGENPLFVQLLVHLPPTEVPTGASATATALATPTVMVLGRFLPLVLN